MRVIDATGVSDAPPHLVRHLSIVGRRAQSADDRSDVTVQRFTDGISIVRVVGDIDSSSYLRLYDDVMTELHERRCHGLIIDLSQVIFCCASGLSCLIQAHDAAQQAGVDLRIAVPPSAAQLSIWRLRDLRDTLKIAPTAAAARTSIHTDWSPPRAAAHP